MDDSKESRRLRLNEFKNTLNINNLALSKAVNTNPGFISQMLNGKRKITAAFAYTISKCYSGFNADWLITGRGTMFISEKDVNVREPDGEPAPGILSGVMEEAGEYTTAPPGVGMLERAMQRLADLEEQVRVLRVDIAAMQAQQECFLNDQKK